MDINDSKACLKADIEAVITSYNQGSMVLEAVQSVCNQTVLPKGIIIIDDGSTDRYSLDILDRIKNDFGLSVPITIHFQENKGVSAARNIGISKTQSSMVLVLDGDDKLEAGYIENVSKLLCDNPKMVIASSWMRTFGVLDVIVRPAGGNIVSFLSHNCCPATHILRKKFYKQCEGYDESMRSGFEDWDFFLSMLETMPDRLQFLFQKLSDIWIIFLTQCRLERHITAFLIRFAVQRKGISHDTFWVAVIGIDEPFAGGSFLDFLLCLFGQGVKKTLVLV